METVWFILVALMSTAYVILDGFDLGAGILHLVIARTDNERRTVIRTIGPVWDGNEVFLIAAGGTLFFAFPALYAASFGGFYLPLCIVLWLLIGRAIGIEFRHHLDSKVWTDFFDGCFCISSALLAIFFGRRWGMWCVVSLSTRMVLFSLHCGQAGEWIVIPAFWIGIR